jgi:hypothetical protein
MIDMAIQEKDNEWWACQMTTIFVSLFIGFNMNYFYGLYLQKIVMTTYETIIKVADQVGFVDLHFIRLIILTFFSSRSDQALDLHLKDLAILIGVVYPLFIIALRFWTAPSYLNYCSRMNASIAPLAFVAIFFS